MPSRNTSQSFGSVTRIFHWLTALIILANFPLGIIANDMAFDTPEALAQKIQLFSMHKTLGVLAFFVGSARILWALFETHPVPLNPDRKIELFVARFVHWMLYVSLVAVPLSGWIGHAALSGFAPILWPFGDDLPFVPKSEAVAGAAGAMHWIFTKLLMVSILLHIVGALKHHILDRDATLMRMARGAVAGGKPASSSQTAPAAIAIALFAVLAVAATKIPAPEEDAQSAAGTEAPASEQATTEQKAETPAPAATQTADAASTEWEVTQGSLGFTIKQMGADVQGSFANWTADIDFAEDRTDGKPNKVKVTIDTGSLTLGSVTDQAKGSDFFDIAQFPQAVFQADIVANGNPGEYIATGALTLHGETMVASLPFTLEINGDTAKMVGSTELDRRHFKMGQTYADESTVGFMAKVNVELTAKRK